MAVRFIDADGREVEVPRATATGDYLAPNGVRYVVQEGDAIPPGWEPVEKPKTAAARGKARSAPSEDK